MMGVAKESDKVPPIIDTVGAFCKENNTTLEGSTSGPLTGTTFAVKDVIDVAGSITGFGSPDWLRTHEPATRNARVVQCLLDAGANMAGKTLCDELTYSITGDNAHYGAPGNTQAPDRVPGGSSSGSASAVAAGLVDFALGTDCGGSVRIPASYCGILSLRPTVDRVSVEGVIPFGPPFDVVGWFARDAKLLERVGRILLSDDSTPSPPKRLLLAEDAFALIEPDVRGALEPAVDRVKQLVSSHDTITVSPAGLTSWFETFRVVQAAAIWHNLGAWVSRVNPDLGPGIRDRFDWASRLSAQDITAARHQHEEIKPRLDELFEDGDILCLPTSPRVAPLRSASVDDVETRFRTQAMHILCIAGLGGLPQISLPLAKLDGLPLGLSLVGPRGADIQLLQFAGAIFKDFGD